MFKIKAVKCFPEQRLDFINKYTSKCSFKDFNYMKECLNKLSICNPDVVLEVYEEDD